MQVAGERTLRCLLYFDGVQPHKDDARYSVTPFVLTAVNVPPDLRWSPAYSACLGLLPGSRNKNVKVRMDSVLELIFDELEYAWTVGIQVCVFTRATCPASCSQ